MERTPPPAPAATYQPANNIVIIGGGIIGLCTAYYLLTSPLLPAHSTVSLVESSTRGIAQAASKSAGGFISKHWHDPAVLSLAAISWEEHERLAAQFDGATHWGWRRCGAVGLTVGDDDKAVQRSAYRNLPQGRVGQVVQKDWLTGIREDMSDEGSIGQLDPAMFCSYLYSLCVSLGLQTHFAVPLSSLSSTARSLTLRPHATPRSMYSLRYSTLIIAAGPWSSAVCETLSLPALPLSNLPGHSILVRPALAPTPSSISTEQGPLHLPNEAVFAGLSGAAMGVHASTSGEARSLTDKERSEGFTRSPEFFPRTNGLVYIAGENSIPSTSSSGNRRYGGEQRAGQGALPNRLPDEADDVEALLDENLIARLIVSAAAVSPLLDLAKGATIERRQFCYRPITPDGAPLVGKLCEGVFVATGHGPWGITLAPGTGRVMAELILSPKNATLSADLSGLSVHRFKSSSHSSASDKISARL